MRCLVEVSEMEREVATREVDFFVRLAPRLCVAVAGVKVSAERTNIARKWM